MKRIRRQIILWSCLLLSTGLSFGQGSKISLDLVALLQGLLAPVDVVVQYNAAPGLLDITKLLTQGGTINAQYTLIPGIAVRLPATVVSILALDPSVAYITPDRQIVGTLDYTTAAVNANLAYQAGYTGAGVGIAILDSGIYAHPDVASRVVYRESFVAKKNADDYGHGTHVAGIAAGSGASSTGSQFTRTFRGVAPGASLIDLRVLDAHGMSNDSVIVSALERCGQPEVAVQHPSHQSVRREADFRKLFPRSDLPGRDGSVEEGHRRCGCRGKSGPQRLCHHHFARQHPRSNYGRRHEDHGDVLDER